MQQDLAGLPVSEIRIPRPGDRGVQNSCANASCVEPHQLDRRLAARRESHHVPLPDPENLAQVAQVQGTTREVVRPWMDSGRQETIAARSICAGKLRRGRLIGKGLKGKLIELRTSQVWLGRAGPSNVDQDQVAIASVRSSI
jgi:hypothetical protein